MWLTWLTWLTGLTWLTWLMWHRRDWCDWRDWRDSELLSLVYILSFHRTILSSFVWFQEYLSGSVWDRSAVINNIFCTVTEIYGFLWLDTLSDSVVTFDWTSMYSTYCCWTSQWTDKVNCVMVFGLTWLLIVSPLTAQSVNGASISARTSLASPHRLLTRSVGLPSRSEAQASALMGNLSRLPNEVCGYFYQLQLLVYGHLQLWFSILPGELLQWEQLGRKA